jgi:hypothetical protein
MYYESNYLAHYGILGMKWGKRRYQNPDGTLTSAGKRRQAKEDYNRELEEKRKSLNDEGDKYYEKSKQHKWHLKHPNAAFDDYGDYLSDKPNHKDPNLDEANKRYATARKLSKSYASTQAKGGAFISALMLSPIAMIAASKLTKGKIQNGAIRAATILGSGIGVAAIEGLQGYAQGRSEHKQAVKEVGIKSVKDRIKEL